MPYDFNPDVICSIQKKTDSKKCANYRGITFLNIAYKTLWKVASTMWLDLLNVENTRDKSIKTQLLSKPFQNKEKLSSIREYNSWPQQTYRLPLPLQTEEESEAKYFLSSTKLSCSRLGFHVIVERRKFQAVDDIVNCKPKSFWQTDATLAKILLLWKYFAAGRWKISIWGRSARRKA